MTDPVAAEFAPPPVAVPPTPPRPWGYWATLLWALLAAIVSVIVGLGALLWWRPDVLLDPTGLMQDGSLLSFTTLVSDLVMVAIVALAARIRGWRPHVYLGLVLPTGRQTLIALVTLAVFLLASDGLSYLLGGDVVTPFQTDTYRSASRDGTLVLFWLTLVIVAPASEEILFRGFLFRGWVRSNRSAWLGILIITALFAIIHVQYDWIGIAQVFAIGLLLAWFRWRSGSTLLTAVMHTIVNFAATVEIVLTASG
jgi:CAAX protease family protein